MRNTPTREDRCFQIGVTMNKSACHGLTQIRYINVQFDLQDQCKGLMDEISMRTAELRKSAFFFLFLLFFDECIYT